MELAYRKMTWRSLQTRREGEGEAVAAATACGGDGGARAFMGEGEREEGRPLERGREVQGGAWCRAGHPGDVEEDRQAGAVARGARARTGHTPRLLARGGGRCGGQWAGPAQLGWHSARPQVAQVSIFPILFSFYFLTFVSDLVKYEIILFSSDNFCRGLRDYSKAPHQNSELLDNIIYI